MNELGAILGIAAPFDRPSVPLRDSLGEFVETIAADAFASAHGTSVPIVALDHSEAALQLGTGTVWVDPTIGALLFRLPLSATARGAGTAAMMATSDWGASVMFDLLDDARNGAHRTILAARLRHVALVHSPAYPQTSAWIENAAPACLDELDWLCRNSYRSMLAKLPARSQPSALAERHIARQTRRSPALLDMTAAKADWKRLQNSLADRRDRSAKAYEAAAQKIMAAGLPAPGQIAAHSGSPARFAFLGGVSMATIAGKRRA